MVLKPSRRSETKPEAGEIGLGRRKSEDNGRLFQPIYHRRSWCFYQRIWRILGDFTGENFPRCTRLQMRRRKLKSLIGKRFEVEIAWEILKQKMLNEFSALIFSNLSVIFEDLRQKLDFCGIQVLSVIGWKQEF